MSNKFLKMASLCALALIGGGGISNSYTALYANKVSVKVQQLQNCSGIILDDKGSPIAGASIVIKGTHTGTLTNNEGEFSLQGVKKGSVLVVSFIGFETQEVVFDGNPIKLALKEDKKLLDEVVVVGYGSEKKVNLTGAVSSVNGKTLENRPLTNIGQGLQGVVPNLNINVSAAPGQGSSFNIRGTTSINGGSPLILVDGVQMDPNLVNPEDIQSISVLKDAASAAIYGARAGYGVILITTKSGAQNTAPKISFNASTYWSRPAVEMHNVSTLEYLEMRDIANINSGGSGSLASAQLWKYAKAYADGTYKYTEYFDETQSDQKWQYNGSTDWFNELYKTSNSQQYNVSISGGNNNTTYYGSIGIINQNGILKMMDDNYTKYNVNLNLSTKIKPWFKVSGKVINTYSTQLHPTGSANSGITRYGGMLKNDLSPLMPISHSHKGRLVRKVGAPAINDETLGIFTKGNYEYVEENETYYAGQGGYTNPYSVARLGGNTNITMNDLWLTGAVQLTPIKGLIINADYTFNTYTRNANIAAATFYEMKAVVGTEQLYPWTKPSYAQKESSHDYYKAFNIFAEYSYSYNNAHNFKLMAGYSNEYKHVNWHSGNRKELISNDIPSLSMATGEMNVGSGESHWGIEGFFTRLNYNFKNRYLIEFNGRYDGTSKFPKGKRYAFFPSISGAYRISQEPFWKPLSRVWNDFKLSVSYGSLGNQSVGSDFPYLSSYGTGEISYLLGGAKKRVVYPYGTIVSPNLTWEEVKQVNFGVSTAFFDNRFTMDMNYYVRNTNNMLTPPDELPSVLGASLGKENNGSLQTRGWELTIGYKNQLNNGLSYFTNFVLSDYRSKITSYNGNTVKSLGNYYTGMNLGDIWGLTSYGLFQSQEQIDAHASQTTLQNVKFAPGDVCYEDLNGDGKITKGNRTLDDHGDLKIIGNNIPHYSFGLTLGADFKGFDFQVFFQGIMKRDYAVGGPQFWGFTSRWDVPYKASLDYWTPENTNAYFPAPSWQKGVNRETSSRYLQNAAYCRLKNLTFGYTLPAKLTNKLNISKLRFYINGENLFTYTKLHKAFDPETLNNLTYPIQKKVSIGVNLTF